MRAMGKTPKKVAPGGDESDVQVRRLKATNVSSNSSEDGECESEIPTRQKLSGVDKGGSVSKKEFKSKLPAPKVTTRSLQSAKKLDKVVKMQSEAEEAKLQQKTPKEDVKSRSKSNDPEVIVELVTETPQTKKTSDTNQEDSSTPKMAENGFKDENKNGHNENTDVEQSPDFEVSQNGKHEDDNMKLIVSEDLDEVNKIDDVKKDQIKESSTDVETNIVESTTTEIPDMSEQTSDMKDKDKSNETANQENPCVSYDSSITLKNIQIKLNDCLKDNSKSEENREQSVEAAYKDLSFGKTLRTISGRRSLSRLRHVTLREHNRMSPNNSLFVNTSTMSQDDDFKVLRHRAGLSDSVLSNGTPSDRKRKLCAEESNTSKKLKTDSESSFFNSSLELLKSFRRPIQVSTPNIEGYKFQTDKLDKDNAAVNDTKNGDNKWCALM
ncbi:uncharacterized protein LOC122510177 [Leptopilina heterotoma]|uniref:uncharacterized protein LOC122510177 n=1 Tax=Leptopilina heterotoma TaxID=63436 RepID=UPI001CA7CA21|nr:uncharacterized protein LOC122510177 [Leptopilina heterotoma]XP_043480572.1 uncharacterized protein LOC122510177 [Leptopilina heterotoma]